VCGGCVPTNAACNPSGAPCCSGGCFGGVCGTP
jgi:hypothetical protein